MVFFFDKEFFFYFSFSVSQQMPRQEYGSGCFGNANIIGREE